MTDEEKRNCQELVFKLSLRILNLEKENTELKKNLLEKGILDADSN